MSERDTRPDPLVDPGVPTGCPVCHATEIRETTPLVPELDRWTCERCGHTWTDSEGDR